MNSNNMNSKNIKNNINKDYILTSPWLVIGGALILFVIVVIFSVDSAYREKSHMTRALVEKGESLITAFEAGARTGMMRMHWGGGHLQRLIEETGKGPDIKHIIIADSTGRILNHSNPDLSGGEFDHEILEKIMKSDSKPLYRIVDGKDGGKVFELFDIFRPMQFRGFKDRQGRYPMESSRGARNGGGNSNRNGSSNGNDNGDGNGSRIWNCNGNVCIWDQGENRINYVPPLLISVGLDMTHFESARSSRIRNAFIMAGVILALGMSGFVSLFWLQNYRLARKRFEDTSAFADRVISSLPVGVLATGSDGKIAVFNETIEKISGISRQDALGLPLEEVTGFFMGDNVDAVSGKSLLDRCGAVDDHDFCRNDTGVSERETRLLFRNGRSFHAGVTTAYIDTDSEKCGGKSGIIMIVRDLTRIKELESSLVRHEKLAAIGSLSAGVAHEIRNPLSSIKGLATYFRDLFPEGSDSRDTANVIINEVDRINRVIKDLLEFARPSEISRSETDFSVLLNHVIRLVSMDAKNRNIEIRSDIPESLRVLIDADRISQVLINLFRNAIEAMGKGGLLTVKTFLNDRNVLVINVSDTGTGIDPKDEVMVFNPYYTTKNDGTGLGLAVAQKIVESHGGTIGIRSEKGAGTTVIIEIPRAAS
jgi:two-component system sensor histidine kinase HydH